jgi:type III secretion protein J
VRGLPAVSFHSRLIARYAFAALLMVSFAGCRETLHSQLSEQEANDIVAVLARGGIDGTKTAKGDKNWGVEVSAADMSYAVEALNAAGLPRQRFSSLGDMFRREGIVSTPTEERVRFMHGISQELAHTLTSIDGVLAARVHLVIPQNDPLADKAKVSSASVFVKHRLDVDLQPQLPAIKSLVLRSVEGLTFDTVYVSFFPAERVASVQRSATRAAFLGMDLSRPFSTWYGPFVGVAVLSSFALAAYALTRHGEALRDDLRKLIPGRRDISGRTQPNGVANQRHTAVAPDAAQPPQGAPRV